VGSLLVSASMPMIWKDHLAQVRPATVSLPFSSTLKVSFFFPPPNIAPIIAPIPSAIWGWLCMASITARASSRLIFWIFFSLCSTV